MSVIARVAQPPARPILVFDGDCGFCRAWIRRWQAYTGEAVEYRTSQDPEMGSRFPEIPEQAYQEAVQLVDTDGTVYSAAEAVFRSLAHAPGKSWPWWAYQNLPGWRPATELGYRFIAHHRTFFSLLTRWFWGDRVGPVTRGLSVWFFLRLLGLIYLIAFASFWVQEDGLFGSHGIVPAEQMMGSLRDQAQAAGMGLDRFHEAPTFCWWDASDGALAAQCLAGVIASVCLIADVGTLPALAALWVLYLSLTTVGSVFFEFQWDNLLLETGFLALFLAPLRFRPGRAAADPPSRLVLWLLGWLLFRLMFQSGCVKLLSGDPSWRHLSALEYHYETQPLPTWIGWYAYQLPAWFQKASAIVMFGIELVVPFFIFAPRRLRQGAAFALIFLQIAILLTGNYCFFNLLTIALCLLLFDDAALEGRLPHKFIRRLRPLVGLEAGNGPPSTEGENEPAVAERLPASISRLARLRSKTLHGLRLLLLVIVGVISLMQFGAMFHRRIPWPRPLVAAYYWLSPFRTFNQYGLFAVMTTKRPEIIVEGSMDQVHWRPYSFKYKAGNPKRAPAFVEPYQPRLDWQMWFAALSGYRRNPWFMNLLKRLLQGSPAVLGLMGKNPFPARPPRYIRASLYQYHFTNLKERRATGAWWRRDYVGPYCPVVTLAVPERQSP